MNSVRVKHVDICQGKGVSLNFVRVKHVLKSVKVKGFC